MTTLKNIADKAGFTVSVVSRALNQRPDKHARVAPETKNRIEEVARALGFHRNRGAEFLKRGKSPVIQVFLPDRSSSLMAELMYGMAEVAEAKDFSLGFSLGVTEESFSRFLQLAQQNRNCGVLAYPHDLAAPCWEKVAPDVLSEMKMVALNPNHPVPAGLPTLSLGYQEGGTLAARRLLSQGCVHLAVVGTDKLRMAGFVEEAAEQGAPIRFFEAPEDKELESWVRSGPGPAGLFAVTDVLAFQALNRLSQLGVAVPSAAKIIGYDDLDFAPHTTPALTTVRQDYREQGREAVRMIVRQIYGETVESKVISPSLIVRESA